MSVITKQEQIIVSHAMTQYGGEFVHALGLALGHADEVNAKKINKAFPLLWERYIELYCVAHLQSAGHASEQDVSDAQLEAEVAATSR